MEGEGAIAISLSRSALSYMTKCLTQRITRHFSVRMTPRMTVQVSVKMDFQEEQERREFSWITAGRFSLFSLRGTWLFRAGK
jgi:hypothetical protein